MNIVFEVQNMKCEGCASTIQTELVKLQGIKDVCVVPDTGLVTLSVGPEFDRFAAIDRLRAIGYPLVGRTNKIEARSASMVSCMSDRLTN